MQWERKMGDLLLVTFTVMLLWLLRDRHQSAWYYIVWILLPLITYVAYRICASTPLLQRLELDGTLSTLGLGHGIFALMPAFLPPALLASPPLLWRLALLLAMGGWGYRTNPEKYLDEQRPRGRMKRLSMIKTTGTGYLGVAGGFAVLAVLRVPGWTTVVLAETLLLALPAVTTVIAVRRISENYGGAGPAHISGERKHGHMLKN